MPSAAVLLSRLPDRWAASMPVGVVAGRPGRLAAVTRSTAGSQQSGLAALGAMLVCLAAHPRAAGGACPWSAAGAC